MSSNDVSIRVEDLSKIYRIGLKEEMHENFVGACFDFLRYPLKNYRRYRSLYRFEDLELSHSEDRSVNGDIIWALKNISFEVKQGEVIGIIGGNGAGKSTLLKILSRITDPTRGCAQIRGRVSSLLEVGTGFHNELNGRENVYLNGAVLGMSKKEIDTKFDEIVEFSGVAKFIDTPIKRYSSGMKVRLAFSVAAHLEPEILIIDEVLAVGDAAFQRKCLNKMEDIGTQGRTVLFVSHNLPAVTRLCERVILLEEGRLVADGAAQHIVSMHLKSSTGQKGTREWPDLSSAPGNDITRLRAIQVIGTDGCSCESIDIRKEFSVEMEYDILKPGFVFRPVFRFTNEEGVIVFHTIDQDRRWRGRPRPPGRYASRVWIPGNLLAEGMFFCSCILNTVNPDQRQFYANNAVAFSVYDTSEGDSARGDFARTLRGVVRPLLKWSTRYIEDAGNSDGNGAKIYSELN
jgi:lipopolysaccharide transport system ATP-binding protein